MYPSAATYCSVETIMIKKKKSQRNFPEKTVTQEERKEGIMRDAGIGSLSPLQLCDIKTTKKYPCYGTFTLSQR